MTPEDEAFLTEMYQALHQEAVGPDSPFYVALEELPGNVLGQDAVPRLAKEIRFSTPGNAFFLTGLRGSGKSSQLRRLRRDLGAAGFAVVMVDAENYLDLRRPIDVTQMLFFLVGAIWDEAVELKWLEHSDVTGGGWDRLMSWLRSLPSRVTPTEVEFSGEVGVPEVVKGNVTLRAELRGNPDFVKKLDAFLQGRQAELLEEARGIVSDMADSIQRHWRGDDWNGLVVIVDSLDHNRAIEAENFDQVRRALANLFDLDRDKLVFPRCRMVFTLPSYIRATGAGARYLTNIKVRERHGALNEYGVEALREVLRKRVPGRDLDRVFADQAQVDNLISASGGHLRMLLGLAVELITQAETLPTDEHTVESSIQQVRNTLLPIPADQLQLLRKVDQTHQLPLGSEQEWHIVAELLNERLVLGYQNGEHWYCVHPLLQDRVTDGSATS